ncbi:hypothetical protein CCMA1212_006502, partial [Trichoderma ghanense]
RRASQNGKGLSQQEASGDSQIQWQGQERSRKRTTDRRSSWCASKGPYSSHKLRVHQPAGPCPSTSGIPWILPVNPFRVPSGYRLSTPLKPASRLSKLAPFCIVVFNMASPLRPGGATSQAEWLCSRTTLNRSLREEFYRLPEVSAVYTPDVLRIGSPSTWSLRPCYASQTQKQNQQGELVYSEQRHRDMVLARTRCVMLILRAKHIDRVVLGAWGCGAYGNPVEEIASAWRRCFLGLVPEEPTGLKFMMIYK